MNENDTQIHCDVIKGKELTKADLSVINSLRRLEFNSKSPVDPAPENDDWVKDYFLLKNVAGELLAFGRLHQVEVEFQGKPYSILGIATIVSAIKGKGYGKRLMLGIKEFATTQEKTAIGFCNPTNTPFYEKCGYRILVDGVKQFAYRESDGNLVFDGRPGDVLYLDGKDELMAEVLDNPQELVYMSRKHW